MENGLCEVLSLWEAFFPIAETLAHDLARRPSRLFKMDESSLVEWLESIEKHTFYRFLFGRRANRTLTSSAKAPTAACW
jgi:hypothetical protein